MIIQRLLSDNDWIKSVLVTRGDYGQNTFKLEIQYKFNGIKMRSILTVSGEFMDDDISAEYIVFKLKEHGKIYYADFQR